MNKKYDIIVFGASGFTGQLICDYLSSHKNTKNMNWAIAGRNQKKLDIIKSKNDLMKNIDVLKVDSFDHDSVDNMCSQSKLILTTVGPYSIYGEYLIESCIKHSTHYIDLTGEPDFVNKIKSKYSDDAQKSGSIIINCCGLESIIPDIGTYQTVRKMKSEEKDVTYFMKTKGEISGGTWASFINSISSGRGMAVNKGISTKRKKIKKIFYNKELRSWAIIFPVIDKQIVYRTSRKFKEYGQNFSFNEYMLLKSLFQIIILIIGVFFVGMLSRFKFIKNWLLSLKPSGSGPSEEKRNKHWFEAIFIGRGNNESVKYKISGGDPGYGETSKFISEMALCIILQSNELINDKGIMTPVECTGNLLIKRLENAGIKFEYF